MKQKLVESGAKVRLFESVFEARAAEMTLITAAFLDTFNFTGLGDLVKHKISYVLYSKL